MKTIHTLILLFPFGLNLLAQGNLNQQYLNNMNHNAIVKPLYDSIDEWPDPSHTQFPAQYLNTNFNYDANGNLLSDVFQQDTGYGYLNLDKTISTYLPNNLVSTSISQSWGYSSGWINGSQYIYTYIANKYPDSTLGQYWKNNAWHDTTLVFYQYNSSNLDTCETHQLFNASNWTNYYRYLYFYNAAGSDTCTIQQNWNGSNWVNISKNATYYNSKNEDTFDVHLIWIDTASYWGNNEKNSHMLNVNGLDSIDILTLGSLHYWGNPYEETSFTYDKNNNLISYLADNYPGSSGVLYENIVYAYDANNILLSSMTTSAPYHQDSMHYYFHQVVGISQLVPKVILPVYPNPSNASFTINNIGKEYTNCIISIYNMAGQEVYKTSWKEFNTPKQVILNAPNGVYLLHFISDQGSSYNKLEIER